MLGGNMIDLEKLKAQRADAERRFMSIGSRMDQMAKQRAQIDKALSNGHDEQLILKGEIDTLDRLLAADKPEPQPPVSPTPPAHTDGPPVPVTPAPSGDGNGEAN